MIEPGVIRAYAIKAAIAMLVACVLFGLGYFVALRVSGGSADLKQLYGASVSNLDTARNAQREATERTSILSNELERIKVSIGILRARNGELVKTIERLQEYNRLAGTIQSNVSGGISRSQDIAAESGELIGELGRIAGSLPQKIGSGD